MMGNAITHFMWGYQRHFSILRKCVAQRLFQFLDGRFDPEVFLVGILGDTDVRRFPACVEPEDDFWIHSSAFNDVPALAESLLSQYPESAMFCSHPNAQERHTSLLHRRSLRDAIQRVINTNPSTAPNVAYFVSLPERVGCYLVAVVLGLQKEVLDSHYALTKRSVPMHECRDVPVPTSLIDATIDEFFDDSVSELQKPDAGADLSRLDTEETIRSAGNRLMTGVVWRVDQGRIEGMHNLFRACTVVSSMYYEKAAGAGAIIVARKQHPAVNSFVTFREPVRLTKSRGARKLLQLSSHGLSLHTDSEDVFGLAEVNGYAEQDEDLFEVRILDHHHWELIHAGQVLMRVQYGQPRLPKPSFDESKLRSDLRRLFTQITTEGVEKIVGLVREAENESHGTMLLITENATQEAERLGRQGTPLSPVPLALHMLKHLTPIDGAVILSPEGTCYAIGTILDGMATEEGDPGRGARFNSAVRYVTSAHAPCLAVVISEDGGVDFVPNLRPAIKRSLIGASIAQLGSLKDAPRITRRRYSELLDWCDRHRFYLGQGHCDELNRLVAAIEERLDSEDPTPLKLIRREFVPNPGLDEAMYYESE